MKRYHDGTLKQEPSYFDTYNGISRKSLNPNSICVDEDRWISLLAHSFEALYADAIPILVARDFSSEIPAVLHRMREIAVMRYTTFVGPIDRALLLLA